MLERSALFEIPSWSSVLADVLPFHDEMIAEVEREIDANAKDAAGIHLADQTTTDPFALDSRGWKVLEDASNSLYRRIVQETFQRWRSGEFHLRRWAIRFGRQSEEEMQRLSRESVHNHFPALLSSVYYLSVPDELAGNEAGGTRFLNPLSNLLETMSPRETVVHAEAGKIVVFPSFVDHTPVPIRWTAAGQSRIVVASDLFYVSGWAADGNPAAVPVGRGA